MSVDQDPIRLGLIAVPPAIVEECSQARSLEPITEHDFMFWQIKIVKMSVWFSSFLLPNDKRTKEAISFLK